MLSVCRCSLSSLPKELGELSGLEVLAVSHNEALGAAPQEESFPAELKGMRSLRMLKMYWCNLRRVPAFVVELKSLECLELGYNESLQIDASTLDSLIEGGPRLRYVNLGGTQNPEVLALLEAFKAKLKAKNPKAEV